jgi:hypothetical protein
VEIAGLAFASFHEDLFSVEKWMMTPPSGSIVSDRP